MGNGLLIFVLSSFRFLRLKAPDGLPAHCVRMHIERVGKQNTLSYALNKKALHSAKRQNHVHK
ncbi:hypothetical protein BMT55_15395 [Listeria newyorkensis]|uniref:Uncharacterized protein n=1 Tax=Listeria newyorkensis TaxID=1497681 RepID=A0ABX4XI76_9LIST|nr:hypothetical protein EP58_08820 [Listeria newyorkensis]PNP88338.1 hypothetical protein BMT55_15395 [Listeria newyorkensis]